MWIPYGLTVLEDWSNECLVGVLFDGWVADLDVSSQEVEGLVCFGGDGVDVVVPAEVLRDLDSEIFDARMSRRMNTSVG